MWLVKYYIQLNFFKLKFIIIVVVVVVALVLRIQGLSREKYTPYAKKNRS